MMKLKTTNTLTKKSHGKKLEIKRRRIKLKKTNYNWWINWKKNSQKGQRKRITNQNNKDRAGKDKICQIEIEGLNWKQIKLL